MERSMSEKSYTTAFAVDKDPQEVFDAINNVRAWWSGKIEGSTDELGAEFTYSYEKLHVSTQKITEFIPGEKVVWHVVDANISFVEDQTEWKGTDIVFDISKKEGKTEVRFTHVGLKPQIECYDSCSDAWGFYINSSLRKFIGEGQA
jgi:Activator of Hsp90 ATPase homolog 1-like protein